jgi:hypothetical protein
LTFTVLVDDISSSSTETNTASTSAHDEPDLDPSNNSDSVAVDLVPGPKITVTKTSAVVTDGYTTNGNDKSIPGATVRYTVTVTNGSTSVLTFDVTVD